MTLALSFAAVLTMGIPLEDVLVLQHWVTTFADGRCEDGYVIRAPVLIDERGLAVKEPAALPPVGTKIVALGSGPGWKRAKATLTTSEPVSEAITAKDRR